MNECREAFERIALPLFLQPVDKAVAEDHWTTWQEAWQAALASERAKQAEPVAWTGQYDENGNAVEQRIAAPPAAQGEPVGIIHEWKGSRWLVVPICPPGGKLPKIGDRLYAAPPVDDEAVRLLREARGQLGDCSLKNRIDAYLAKHDDHR